MPETRKSRYFLALVGLAIVLVLIARVNEGGSLAPQEFIRTGIFHDSVCYMGSYLIVCPSTAPPYETILVVLAAIFLVGLWVSPRSRQASEKNE